MTIASDSVPPADGVATPASDAALELNADDIARLSATFVAPGWLRALGRASWLIAGVLLVLGGLMWLLGETETIVGPVTAALIVAVVVAPVVSRLEPHVRRTGAAAIVLLSAVVIAVLLALLV